MRQTRTIALAAALAAALTAAAAAPALAGPRPKIALSSDNGHLALPADGSAVVTGTTSGTPFDGSYTAVVTAVDGSLPEPGESEPATATLRVEGARGQVLLLSGTGTVSGEWVGPNAALTHKFVGRYVADSTVRRVDGTDGWYSVGVAATLGLGYSEAYDS
jgi:hypothetical protein